MDQNQAAAKALTLVHKNKKFQICIPQDRVASSSVASRKCLLKTLPVTPSASGSSSLEDSFPDNSPAHTEPMETTDSLVTANTNKSHSLTLSSGSAASSTLIRMHSSHSGENSLLPQTTQPMRIPSDIEHVSSSEGTISIDTSSEVVSTQSSEGVLANHRASASTISSSEIVGMDLSPSVPSGPSFSLPQPKGDTSMGSFLTASPLPDVSAPLPGKWVLEWVGWLIGGVVSG